MGQVPGVLCRAKVNGNELHELIPLTIHRTVGGRELDRATLMLDLDIANQRLQSQQLNPSGGQEIHIVANINGTERVLFWGYSAIGGLDLGQDEQQSLIARVEPWHFGEPIGGQVEAIAASLSDQRPVDLVFNSEIDGKIEPNKFGIGFPRFYDPESARTAASRAIFGGVIPELWTVRNAAEYLCEWLNSSATYIQNPSATEYLVLSNDTNLLKDFRIPIGLYLPEALDKLLEPFGFGWFLENVSETVRRIRFFIKGDGQPVTVYLGPIGSSVGQDNALENKVDTNIGSVRNKIQLLGGFREFESTWELKRAWPAIYDSLDPETDLGKDSANYAANIPYQRAWRDWVLNEAGDYNGTRTEITAAEDLSTLFGVTCTPRRRRFKPTLTQSADLTPAGEIAGLYVEFSTDGGTTWNVLDREHFHAVHVLDNECGIRFDGQLPPAQLMAAGDHAKVRVTATIASDKRLLGTSSTGISPQSAVAGEILNASSRFHYREVLPTSVFYVQVFAGSRTSLAVDDTTAIQAASDQLLEAWNMADVSGNLTLSTLDEGGPANYFYELGQIVTKIEGREIAFNASIATPTNEPRYPQVVGLTWDCQGQKRNLQIETFRMPASLVIG